MIKNYVLIILFFFFASHTMQRPFETPAQQAAAQFKQQIDREFKPELVKILEEHRPLSLLARLKNFYHQNQAMFPSMRELCSSFMLTLKYPGAALGSKITELAPSEVEQAWHKEWALAVFESDLLKTKATLDRLKQSLHKEKGRFLAIVDQQAFYNLEKDLQTKERLVNHAQKIFSQREQLSLIYDKPLELFASKEYRKKYNDDLRELYSLQTIEIDAQDMHHEKLPLLFQLCSQNLSKQLFEQMLHFLTTGDQKLLINKVFKTETVLDYVLRHHLTDYAEIIKKYGGRSKNVKDDQKPKPALKSSLDFSNRPQDFVKKSVSFSDDIVLQEKDLA